MTTANRSGPAVEHLPATALLGLPGVPALPGVPTPPGVPAPPVSPGTEGEHRLQQRLGTSGRAARFYGEQVLSHVNARMREFVARQEMFFLATADGRGGCDNTFRAGPPGFLQVLDDRTLAYPEYRGNGVLASLGNIEENPHVGILMIDFFRDRIGLHVNGRARVVDDADLRAVHPGLPVDGLPGRRPVVWVEIAVEEAYIHCAKHIPHLRKVSREPGRDDGRAWGTDDTRRKGGDFFGAAAGTP
ncbi:pyridoxamine 5'-phosphate oxidase family protein [Streptomyces cinnamoneus]|nr:pyridoxamine 5'-phosphate oxidase family protein [Streptomyces cinnamoneus]